MAFLTIGAVTVSISSSNARLSAMEQIGVSRRSFSGGLLSSVKAEKRVWDVETIPLDAATITTLKAAFALYAIVSVTGDLTQGVATDCRIRVTSETYVRESDSEGTLRTVALEISEV